MPGSVGLDIRCLPNRGQVQRVVRKQLVTTRSVGRKGESVVG